MKEFINYLLSRRPRCYESILRFKGNCNFEKALFLNLIRDGDVALDVGANRGYYTLLFSHLVGRTGQVHAFEPVPPTFEKLSTTVTVGKRFNNIFLNNVALGEIANTVKLYLPDVDDGQASLAMHTSGSWKHVGTVTSFECELIRLDDYWASRPNTPLNFIKCDVEGAELLALNGGVKTIAEHKPIVYLEICRDWTVNFNYEPVEIIECLSAIGYTAFHLVTDGLTRLSNPSDDLSDEKFQGSANLLCSIPEIHFVRIADFIRKYALAQ